LTPGQPAVIRIEERWFGPPVESETVEMLYPDPRDVHNSGSSPNRAWLGARNLSKNTPLTVLMARERRGDVLPGAPFLVTPNERRAPIIRSLTEAAIRLEASPAAVADEVASLERKSDSALAGYLLSYLEHREAIHNPALASTLLTQMVGSPSVPPQVWDEITQDARAEFYRLNAHDRASLANRFSELARNSDMRIAVPAFHALGRISPIGDGIKGYLAPSTRDNLEKVYNEILTHGVIARSPVLEVALGFKLDAR